MAYVTYKDYTKYLNGRTSAISESEFPFWADKSSVYVDSQTYGNIERLGLTTPYPDYLLNCVCAVVDKLYELENSPTASAISSEKVGNYSVTYEKVSDEQVQKRLRDTLVMYLAETGLLYRGIWE